MKVFTSEAHRPFYEHLLKGGTVHRDDKLNNVEEDLTLESLDGDASRVRLYGYLTLSIREEAEVS